ncbi:MAG: peptidylprolyl isomerase [bacterium]
MRNIGPVIIGALMLLALAAGAFLFLGGEEQGVIRTDLGEIVIEFYPGEAPNHVENWIELARQGFYDGTTFHRVVPGFVIQGGDPLSKDDDPYNDGLGGPGWNVNEEFNDIPHEQGIVSMARSGENVNSAGSQFFICLDRLPYLDRQYTVFGRVVEGMDVVDAIKARPRVPDDPDRPIQPVVMREVTVRTAYRVPFYGTFYL